MRQGMDVRKKQRKKKRAFHINDREVVVSDGDHIRREVNRKEGR